MGDIVTTPPALGTPRIDVGDAANFLLGGVPGDVHDLFIVDVEPGDLLRASLSMTEIGHNVRTVHVNLGSSVATLEGRWEGAGASAFQSDIWEPLSDGLDVLASECHTAASQLKALAGLAGEAHAAKVMQIDQEIDTQLNVTAVSWVVGSPEVAGVIREALGNLAARLGGELVSQITHGIVDAIGQLISKVLVAFAKLLEWIPRPVTFGVAEARDLLGGIIQVPGRTDAVPIVQTPLVASVPSVAIGDSQFGFKAARHMRDFGLKVANSDDRAKFRALIRNTADNADEVRQGPWHPAGGGGPDYLFFRRGRVVVVAKSDGTFVTILNQGDRNSWFRGATPR
ncbi:MAG: hypothetical protein JOZ75_10695 [Candidatus Dormibacteraeota bacterium]|nr:hypothetical protein [Candidatus Dormibacteraeota bacterium]